MARLDLFRHFEDVLDFKQGDVLLQQGTQGAHMYALREGNVEIRVNDAPIATLEAGDFFGEMAIIDADNRSGSVVALTDGKMVPITKERFTFLVAQHPFFALEVMRALVERLRATNRLLTAKPRT